jgi:hypothetical protein
MENNAIIKIREFVIRNILILLLFPLITITSIFIIYGNIIDKCIIVNPELSRLSGFLYELIAVHDFISMVDDLPGHIKNLAYYAVYYTYILYIFWLLLFFYDCYFRLSRKQFNLVLIIIEFTILLSAYNLC